MGVALCTFTSTGVRSGGGRFLDTCETRGDDGSHRPGHPVVEDHPRRLTLMVRALVTCSGQVLILAIALPVLLGASLFGQPRRLLAVLASFWSRTILWLAGVRLTIEGIEYTTGGPCFFVGNHPGALDIPVLLVVMRGHIRFMAKESLFKIPLFGRVLRRYGFVPIDRSHPRRALTALKRMLAELRRHPISFAVFPEGTRSPDGRLLPFRKGALRICRDSGLPVVPFAIEGTNRVYTRGRIRMTPGPVRVAFGPPIPADAVAQMNAAALHDRVRGEVARLLGASSEDDPAASPSVSSAKLGALAPEGG